MMLDAAAQTQEGRTIIALFSTQAALMLADEVVFRGKRERLLRVKLAHPLATPSTLVCFLVALFAPRAMWTLGVYAVLAVVACLLATQDKESMETRRTQSPGERVARKLLALLQPAVLFGVVYAWLKPDLGLRSLLFAQAALICAFGTYQFMARNLAPPVRRSRR